jgi:hypothetical protein
MGYYGDDGDIEQFYLDHQSQKGSICSHSNRLGQYDFQDSISQEKSANLMQAPSTI